MLVRPSSFSVIAIFLATALVTLLGVIGLLTIDPAYLNTLFSSLILELVVAVIGLFKATDWFGPSGTLPVASTIQGNWWQFIRQERQNAISFIQITYSEDQQQFLIEGDAYTATDEPFARWWSVGASLNVATRELRYFWTGDHETSEDDFSGVGYFKFSCPAGSDQPDRGVGWYTTGNIDHLNVTAKQKSRIATSIQNSS
ncbi:MAG: hypothetical protein ABFS45_21155 [Pseudomonadota bacterium]